MADHFGSNTEAASPQIVAYPPRSAAESDQLPPKHAVATMTLKNPESAAVRCEPLEEWGEARWR
jgi:hypothetical protein